MSWGGPSPAMGVLCLTDMQITVMDKLLVYVQQMDIFLSKYLTEAEDIGKVFLTNKVNEILSKKCLSNHSQ